MATGRWRSTREYLTDVGTSFGLVVGAFTVYYLLYPPPEPPPLCFEYRLRQGELSVAMSRYQREIGVLSGLQGDLSVRRDHIERVITRYADLQRWQFLMNMVGDLEAGLKRAHSDLKREFGDLEPILVNSQLTSAHRAAWDNLLQDAGFPSGIWPRGVLKYWLDDYTDIKIDISLAMGGPRSHAEVDSLLSFLSSVGDEAYNRFDQIISDTMRVPDNLGEFAELMQRTSLYETAVSTDILERLRDSRISIEERLYQIDRDQFRLRIEVDSFSAEHERLVALAGFAKCAQIE